MLTAGGCSPVASAASIYPSPAPSLKRTKRVALLIPPTDVPEREYATKARSAIVMEPLNSVGIPVERYSKYK